MNQPTWRWLRRIALQESWALRGFVKAGKWPTVAPTRFDG